MDGTEKSTKQIKNKIYCLFYFFIFIPTHQNGPKLGRQEHHHPHCFIKDHHRNHLEGCCQCNLFPVSSLDDLEISLVALNGFKQSCPPWPLQNGVLLVASTNFHRTLLVLHWITSSNSGGAGLPSAMTGIYILIWNYHPKYVISLDSPAVPSQSAAFHSIIWKWAQSMCCRRFADARGKAITLGL